MPAEDSVTKPVSASSFPWLQGRALSREGEPSPLGTVVEQQLGSAVGVLETSFAYGNTVTVSIRARVAKYFISAFLQKRTRT